MNVKKNLLLGLVVVVLAMLLVGCGGGDADSAAPAFLTVGEKTYTVADLEAMPQNEASFNGVAYLGVSVSDLLADAGYSLDSLKAVKAVANDGYTVNYEPDQLSPEDVIVAYAAVDGAMSADDGVFRMVLPGQEGKMNLRMLVELQVIE